MRLSIATANRASIVLLAGLLAGCSNTSPGLQALPLGSSGATPATRVTVAQRRRRSVRLCGQLWLQQCFRLSFDRGQRRVEAGGGLAV